MRKMISTTAALFMAIGSVSAFAQNAPTTAEEPMTSDMSVFYSDSDMKNMRTDAELRETLAQMKPEAREKLREDCDRAQQHRENSHYGLCDKIKAM